MSRYHAKPENLAEAHEGLRQDYAAAKMNRFRRLRTGMLSTIGTGADYHYRIQSDYLRMMEYARDMDRNDVAIGQAVDRAVANALQGGLTPDPQTGDEKLNKDLRDRFDDWAEDCERCDTAGESTFADLQYQVMRAVFVDGDTLALPIEDGQLQVVEAHRLRTPSGTRRNVVHGVLLDENRKRLEYWLTKNDVDPFQPLQFVSDINPIKARDSEGFKQVFHVYNPKRISQTRGVTALAPCFDVAGMMEDINFSAVVRQQVANVFALIRERSKDFKLANSTALGIVTQESVSSSGAATIQQLQGVMPGMEIAGAVGETLRFDGAKVPSSEFFQHIKLMLQLVGANLGLPLILMLMDASVTNFSGWRGALNQAKLGFKHNQQWHEHKLCRPTWIWKVRQFIAEDRSIRKAYEKIELDIFRHRWNKPTWESVNPLQDTQADALEIEKRLTSPRRGSAKRGIEHIDLITETVADNKFAILEAIKASQEIQQETKQSVDWHELLWINNAAPIKTVAQEPVEVGADGKPVKQPPPVPGQPPMPTGQPQPPPLPSGQPQPQPKPKSDEKPEDEEAEDEEDDDETEEEEQ